MPLSLKYSRSSAPPCLEVSTLAEKWIFLFSYCCWQQVINPVLKYHLLQMNLALSAKVTSFDHEHAVAFRWTHWTAPSICFLQIRLLPGVEGIRRLQWKGSGSSGAVCRAAGIKLGMDSNIFWSSQNGMGKWKSKFLLTGFCCHLQGAKTKAIIIFSPWKWAWVHRSFLNFSLMLASSHLREFACQQPPERIYWSTISWSV